MSHKLHTHTDRQTEITHTQIRHTSTHARRIIQKYYTRKRKKRKWKTKIKLIAAWAETAEIKHNIDFFLAKKMKFIDLLI